MIPKIIHQTWRSDKLPNVFQKIYDKNKEVNSDFQFKLWSHAPGPPDIDTFIKNEYPDIFQIYEKTKFGVQKSDIARVLILYHFGGIYYDLDILCLKPFKDLLDLQSNFVYVAKEPSAQANKVFKTDNVLCNAFIAASPNHPLFKQAIEEIKKLYGKYGDKLFNVFNIFGADLIAKSMSVGNIINECQFIKRDLIYPICDVKFDDLSTSSKDIEMIKSGKYEDSYLVHFWIHSDFESRELLEKFEFDQTKNFNQNMYDFFTKLYPKNKYLKTT